MPSTVPWRFWGDGTLGLGLGCWAAAIGAAARHVANVRRLREGIWFTAIPRWFGVGIAYSMPCSGRGGRVKLWQLVGRTPWSAADASVGLLTSGKVLISLFRQRDEGVPRGPGGPPHSFRRVCSSC